MSTYIRWLRPEPLSTSPQEQKPTPHFHHPLTNPNLNQTRGITEVSNLNHYTKEQEIPQDLTPLSHNSTKSSSSSSPTALGLLLKSSMFRELVKKNPNSDNGKGEGVAELETPQEGSEGFSYLCSSSGNRLPNLQSPEEKALPLHHRTMQEWFSEHL